jgi:seryl-tRNA synthetase
MHQFEKVELYTFCTPEQAEHEHQQMLSCAQALLQQLGLHYRISLLAAQDASFAAAKTYDLEVWMPGQGIYKEVSSSSNCTDFQARACNIKHRDAVGGKSEHVYTLNTSSLALPRVMVALMETYQTVQGTVEIPAELKQFVWRME